MRMRVPQSMKKSEIISLYNGLNSVGNLVGVIFGYACRKNIDIIKPEIEALQVAVTPSKEFLELDQKRVDIVKKYANKDEKGNALIVNNQFDVKGNEETVEKEVGVLRDENKDIFEARDKQVNEYNKLLDEDAKVELYKVKLENVPKEITAAQMNSIFAIIEE